MPKLFSKNADSSGGVGILSNFFDDLCLAEVMIENIFIPLMQKFAYVGETVMEKQITHWELVVPEVQTFLETLESVELVLHEIAV